MVAEWPVVPPATKGWIVDVMVVDCKRKARDEEESRACDLLLEGAR